MKRLHKILYVLLIAFILMAAPVIFPMQDQVAVTQAASLSINHKALSLEVGQSKTLKIYGTSRKVTWSSSKKSVAIVSSSGKITAKDVGSTTITAAVSGKKLTCKVIVKEPIKISYKSYNLDIGKTKTLRITGTEKVITWSSSNKKVATVSSKGKVTALASGWATITASVDGKKLSCVIKVYKDNPYRKKAPFAATELRLSDFSIVIPKGWYFEKDISEKDEYYAFAAPSDSENGSYVMLYILDTGEKSPTYKEAKKELQMSITKASIKAYYESFAEGLGINVTGFKQKDYKAAFGDTLQSYYTLRLGEYIFKESVYAFYLDGYYIEITVTDSDEAAGFPKTAEYILNSFMIKK